eukprot:3383235-Amphidinium_carterae.1
MVFVVICVLLSFCQKLLFLLVFCFDFLLGNSWGGGGGTVRGSEEKFGSERLLWGSDFPYATAHGDYKAATLAVEESEGETSL